MRLAALVIGIVFLVGCGPDIKLGPGTVIQADSDVEYRQDNNWVYSTGRSDVRAKSLSGQHCDSLNIYLRMDSVASMNGVNCHDVTHSLSGTCAAVTDKGYAYVDCATGNVVKQ
jgi:hypothetical protein